MLIMDTFLSFSFFFNFSPFLYFVYPDHLINEKNMHFLRFFFNMAFFYYFPSIFFIFDNTSISPLVRIVNKEEHLAISLI